jgi:hypothetical protein
LLTKGHGSYPVGNTVKQTQGVGINDEVEESLDDEASEAEKDEKLEEDEGVEREARANQD